MNKNLLATIGLTVVSVVGVAATAVLAAKATPKALEIIRHEEEEVKHEELTKFEKVQVTLPVYAPAIAVGVATAACIIFSNVLNVKQVASLTASYALIEQTFKQYRGKVTDIFGTDEELKVREAVSHEKYPLPDEMVPDDLDSSSADEKLFCFHDGEGKRYFWSTPEKVLKAEFEVNKKLAAECMVTVQDFYDILGVEGDQDSAKMGWNSDMFYKRMEYQWIDFTHEVTKSDDPDSPDCIDIYPDVDPCPGYDGDEWEDYLTHKFSINKELANVHY